MILKTNYPKFKHRKIAFSNHATNLIQTDSKTLGEQYAKERGFKLTKFPADCNKYGKSAGPKQN